MISTNTNDTLICFVLDKSGSMGPVMRATCEGFNQFKTDQKANPGHAFMTLTLFDTAFDTRFVGTPLAEVADLGSSGNPYQAGGLTALFDAVGESIKATERWVAERSWTGRVMVVTLTDGEENRSQHWHVNNPRIEGDAFDVAGLIDWKQKENWDFVFLGAGGTEWLERTFQNLPKESFFGYRGDIKSTGKAYASLNSAVTRSRAGGQTLASTLADEPTDGSN